MEGVERELTGPHLFGGSQWAMRVLDNEGLAHEPRE